jgi:hypothetical protein
MVKGLKILCLCVFRNAPISDFLQIILLNPNFLLIHRNRYLEGIDNGQKTPHGHPDFNSYVKIPRVFIDNGQTNRQTDKQTNRRTDGEIHSLRVGWRNFFPVVLLCQVFVLAGNRC